MEFMIWKNYILVFPVCRHGAVNLLNLDSALFVFNLILLIRFEIG